MRSPWSFVVLVIALLLGSAPVHAQTEAPSLRDLIEGESGGPSVGAGEPSGETEPEPVPPGSTPRSTMRAFFEAVNAGDYVRGSSYLDLSRTDAAGTDLARHLEVVLDQTVWIDLRALSDEPDGNRDDGLAASRERVAEVAVGDRKVPILLDRVPVDGHHEWRISAATVAQIPRLYEAHGHGPLGTHLPDLFFEVRVLELQLWQWLGLLALILVAGVLSWVIAILGTTIARNVLRHQSITETATHMVEVAAGPARLAIGVALFSAGKHLLALAIPVVSVLVVIEDVLLIVASTWAALRLVEVFEGVVERRLRDRGQESVVSLLPPGRKTLKAFVIILAVLATLESFGFSVTAVLAGLGVGGIAIALAAQKTVENLFGGATLYGDRPVRVGDFCRFGDRLGTVEEIGLRSTRVRTLDRTVVTVPNAEFANLHLENYTSRDRIWYNPRIGLRYETTPDQLRYVLVEVRRMLYAHPKVDPDPARIRFTNFGAYSLDLDVFAYVSVTDYGEFLEVAEDLNLRIMDIVEEAGSSFAFPSQTTYLEQGEPLDEKRQKKVGEAVAGWRENRQLYLPRFPEERVDELRDTLDFPPEGSPFARNGSGT